MVYTREYDTVNKLCKCLQSHRFTTSSEAELQLGVAKVLTSNSINFHREYRLSAHSRVDFFIGDGIALELKVARGMSSLLRQVARYASHDVVTFCVVVGTPAWIDTLPRAINGKPLFGLRLVGSLF
jgi:hypothetical protein